MNTEHSPKTPSPRTGIFARLSCLLGAEGTGASKTTRGTGASEVGLVSQVWYRRAAVYGCAGQEGGVGTRVSILPRGGSTGSSAARAPVSFSARLLLFTVLAFLVCFTGSSLAETGHGFTGTIGGPGHGAGQLEEPTDVAVNDATHDVYVADKGNNRIDEFEADGTFIRAWGWGVVPGGLGGFETCGPDAIPATACQAGSEGAGAGQLDAPEAIAVDNDATSASKEDVYVTTADAVIEKFSATGAYEGQLTGTCPAAGETQAAGKCEPSTTTVTPFTALFGVAIDPEGDLWVTYSDSGNGSIAEFGDTGSFTESVETSWGFIPGSAVDSSDDVYQIVGFDWVTEFDPTTGAEILHFSENASGVAVDSAENDVYVDQRGKIAQYGTSQELIHEFGSEQLTDGGGSGVVVDSSNGTVYVADSTSDDVIVYSEGLTPEVPLTGTPEEVEATRETLKGELNPKATAPTGALKYQFDYNAGASCTGGLSIPVPAGEVAEASKKVVEDTALHLTPESGYTYCLVAKGTYGETRGNEVSFTTPGSIPPEHPEVLEPELVTARTATLKGVVNPNTSEANFGSYEFRYRMSATEECQGGAPGPEEEKATPKTATFRAEKEAAQAQITGLLPHTTYTFCLRAENEAEQSRISPPQTFTTLAAEPEILSESVSAVESKAVTLDATIVPNGAATTYRFEYLTAARFKANGETFAGATATPESASIGADDTAHAVTATIEDLTPGTTYRYRVIAENEVETVPGEGKTFTTNPTPGTEPPQNCPNEQRRAEQPYGLTLPDCRAYEMVSPVETDGTDATDPDETQALIKAGYVRASEAKGAEAMPAITYASLGSFGEPGGATIESQLLSRRNDKEGRWETRSITAPYEHDQNGEGGAGYYGVFFTPELTEGLTVTAADLSSEAPAGLVELYRANFPEDLDLHQPISYQLVSQLPPSEEFYAQPYLQTGDVVPLGASSDLSHVVFTTEAGEQAEVGPLREWVAGRVVSVGVSNTPGEVWTGASVGSSPSSGLILGGEDVWRAVSEDGSRVVFNRSGGASGALYVRLNGEREQSPMKNANTPDEECEDPADACTIKLSAGDARYVGANTNDSKIFYVENEDLYEYTLPIGAVKGQARDLTPGGEVQGVAQVSEDGSYVYFVANGVLAAGATSGDCRFNKSREVEEGHSCNLYVSHEGGEPAFIATLSANDSADWLAGPGADTAVLASGAAGGARLAFTSSQSLTGYDNRHAGGGELDSEVYLYDAETSVLVCASCNPSGARPVGPASLATGNYGAKVTGASNYRPRDLLADGSLFFDSSDALVPHASDGRQNVYEYEDGHVYPISNVSGGHESFFLDASPDGQDVFFASADQLLPEDTGNNVVVWDARQDGGFPVLPPAPSCNNADACKPPPSAQPSVFAPTGSATFNGLGNLPPGGRAPNPVVKPKAKVTKCKRGYVKEKVKKKETCVKKKSKKMKAKKSAHANGRTH
jgi:hypothetical protein